jgi:uridine kinase
LLPEEPDLGPWQSVPAADVIAALLRMRPPRRPVVLAVDGRSAAGKSTTAGALHAAANDVGERAVLLHTDDIAWRQARFDWDHLLVDHVLAPSRSGDAVRWRPPAWTEHGREGAIEVPAGTTLLLLEGVGVARRTLASLLDFVVWVQADTELSYGRGIARDCAQYGRSRAVAKAVTDEWMTEELPHLAGDRPWERANLVVAGTDVAVTHGVGDLVVAVRSQLLAD